MRHARQVAFLNLSGTALASGFRSLAAVDETMPAQYTEGLERLNHVVIERTITGSAETILGDVRAHQTAGSLTLQAPGAALRHYTGATPWRLRYLVADGPLADHVAATMAAFGSRMFLYQPAPSGWLTALDEAVHAGLHGGIGWDWRLLRSFTTLAEGMHREPRALGAVVPLATRLAQVIDATPTHAWSLPALARELGISRSALCAQATASLGKPIMTWVRERRLMAAETLLRNGLSVGACAEALGFSSPFAFSRAFAGQYGEPPSSRRPRHEWRALE